MVVAGCDLNRVPGGPVAALFRVRAKWRVLRPLLPVPAWLEGRGGRPEGCCHRVMLDAVRYVLDKGVKWVNLPSDFPLYRRVRAFARRWQVTGLLAQLHDRRRDRVQGRCSGRWVAMSINELLQWSHQRVSASP
ncbi:transposase [Streptomyces sp. NPDC001139]